WLHPQLYPNPVSNVLNLDLSYDSRWVGKSARIVNISGQTVMQFVISTKIMQLQINKLSPGLYFIAAKREDGLSLKLQFVKL
ncbi:MAG TPA: T9SS type A sorting domain-containing protein, partial [Chitinophagaceae bacterium]|nr:T9SS type A sorting domain-containing protein [Chitinophagaceae bacterium]